MTPLGGSPDGPPSFPSSVSDTTFGIGMLGNGFITRAHTKALVDLNLLTAARPRAALVSICGREADRLAASARQYGYARHTTSWRELVSDADVGILCNTAVDDLHCQPTLAALAAGKHVLCEKPLAPTADEAFLMWDAAASAGTVHMCGYNFRFTPAIGLARMLVHSGEIGAVLGFRAEFLESVGLPRDADTSRRPAWNGAVRTLGSHIVDLARFLVGEPALVQATATSVTDAVDTATDSFAALLTFDSGATGILEGSRIAGGISSECRFRIDGTRGGLHFSSHRLNELHHTRPDHTTTAIEVTQPDHPFMDIWWPEPGHPIGWADTFTHQVGHFLRAIATGAGVAPDGADFRDGYHCAEVCDAIARAASTGQPQPVVYRSVASRTAQ